RQACVHGRQPSAPAGPAPGRPPPPPRRADLAVPRRRRGSRLRVHVRPPPAHACAPLARGDPERCSMLQLAARGSPPCARDWTVRGGELFGRELTKLAASAAKVVGSLALRVRRG